MKVLMVSQVSSPIPSPSDRIFAPGMICYNLAKGLKEFGHQVKVYASEDSDKSVVEIEGLGVFSGNNMSDLDADSKCKRLFQHELFSLSSAFTEYKEGGYDLLHLNSFPVASYFSGFVDGPITCTHHGIPDENNDLKLDIDKLRQKKYLNRIKYIAVSKNQRELGRDYFNYVATIHHGIDIDKFEFNSDPSDSVLFAGRMIEGKNPHLAIEAALGAGTNIDMVGTIDKTDAYYQRNLGQYEGNNKVNFCGHVEYAKMHKYFGNARALIFPITWDEAFGLVMIEAMACGTPVIAFDRGPVREIIKDGETGFIVPEGDIATMTEAIKRIDQIDRHTCRTHVEENFTTEIMVSNYENFFLDVISNG